MKLFPFLVPVPAVLLLVGIAGVPPGPAPPHHDPPGTEATRAPWRMVATPEEAGFSPTRLDTVHALADRVGSAAVVAVSGGHVLLAWGDVDRQLKAHSVRKSFLSALYGTAVADGDVSLEVTLDEMGIDDRDKLTAEEKRATVADLLAARSGVYHPSAYSPASMDENLPARGSHPPGTHWYYNNWDFNVLGTLYERATGEELFESFERRIARPLGMEDWSAADGFDVYEPSASRHAAYTFRMSARDMARFGWMVRQGGRWRGERVVPAEWIERSTRTHTEFGDGRGYGYMWWTYEPGSLGERYPHADRVRTVLARGTGGQGIFVIPEADLVVVHRADTDLGRHVAGPDVWRIVDGILGAREGRPAPEPRLTALQARPLPSLPPAAELPEPISPDALPLEDYTGEYALGPELSIRVFLFEGRPFIAVPGEGEGELVPIGPDRFWVPAAPGVTTVEFHRDAQGRVVRMTGHTPGRLLEAEKRR